MCPTHYSRTRDGRDTTAPLKRRQRQTATCSIEGCGRTSKQHNLCGAHAHRLRVKGSTLAHIPVRPIGKQGDGHINSNGYRCIGNSLEHRLVMEDHLDRPLRSDEHVHHINGDRLDNRLENLEMWVVRRQPAGQRVTDRVADAIDILERYAPELLADQPTQLRVVA